MKILHVKGFSERERREQTAVIRENVHDSLCEIIKNLPKLELQFELSENQLRAERILRGESESYVENIKWLLQDSGFKKCLDRANEFQLMDNAK